MNYKIKNSILPKEYNELRNSVDWDLKKDVIKMEKFYFEKPSIKRKNEIIEYLEEFVKYGSDINGSGSLDRIYDGYTFEEALDRCLKMEDEEYAKSVNRCPGKTFLLIRENDNKIIVINYKVIDNTIYLKTEKSYKGIFLGLLKTKISKVESSYKGYFDKEKKIIERNK